MKLVAVGLAACSMAIFLPRAGSSQDTVPRPLHLYNTESGRVSLTADSIEREDPPAFGSASPYAPVTRLRGHVEIRTCCVQLTPGTANAYMILHADEVDYHEASGEMEARGTVRINFQPAGVRAQPPSAPPQ